MTESAIHSEELTVHVIPSAARNLESMSNMVHTAQYSRFRAKSDTRLRFVRNDICTCHV